MSNNAINLEPVDGVQTQHVDINDLPAESRAALQRLPSAGGIPTTQLPSAERSPASPMESTPVEVDPTTGLPKSIKSVQVVYGAENENKAVHSTLEMNVKQAKQAQGLLGPAEVSGTALQVQQAQQAAPSSGLLQAASGAQPQPRPPFHPEATAQQVLVTPPQMRVRFDIEGFGELPVKYHDVLEFPGMVVLIHDLRFDPECYLPPVSAGPAPTMAFYTEGSDHITVVESTGFVYDYQNYRHCILSAVRVVPYNESNQPAGA